MSQVNFAYAMPANDAAGMPLSLSIYADRPHVRDLMREDAEAAGFHIAAFAPVADLLEADGQPLGEVVMLDCPSVSAVGWRRWRGWMCARPSVAPIL